MRALLGTSELRRAATGYELARRRQITLSPGEGAVAELRNRVPVAA